ncbi:MAG: hypothetical protein GY760_18045 [Deltaproteobacteria bacterium]|nr:hypothetical protein [Deltaproteobacteria bacterium]
MLIFKKKYRAVLAVILILLCPFDLLATQMHSSSEGIITHQIGHIFFLFSMLTLIFTIKGKKLNTQRGWQSIQYSAFFFILWNLNVITTHFLDNQIYAVKLETISFGTLKVFTKTGSPLLTWLYYLMKLDHLLSIPAMIFLYKGLSNLLSEQRKMAKGVEI